MFRTLNKKRDFVYLAISTISKSNFFIFIKFLSTESQKYSTRLGMHIHRVPKLAALCFKHA